MSELAAASDDARGAAWDGVFEDLDEAYAGAVLRELIDIGMALVRSIRDEGGPDASVRFERVSRAVRRSIMLARLLQRRVPAARAAARTVVSGGAVQVRGMRVEPGEPGEAAQASERAEAGDPAERLDRPDWHDIEGRPVADVIAEICRDLDAGAAPGARVFRRRPAQAAVLRARAPVAAVAVDRGAAERAGREWPGRGERRGERVPEGGGRRLVAPVRDG